MRMSLLPCFFFNLYIATYFCIAAVSVTDCCSWDGISCDESGRVTELDLSDQSISGAIDESNSLFRLRHLQKLNLAYNKFTSEFSSEFENLTNLSYLNLSNAGFSGQIPAGISRLKRLVTLDLSISWLFGVAPKLEKPNIVMLVQNLTSLKHLYLDGVNISASGNEWSEALPLLLPNLQVLSMIKCYLSGPISPSLAKLQSLSVIRLSLNNLSGLFPEEIMQSPKLQTLDLSYNECLEGSFRTFPRNASLQSLVVSGTNFGGQLPESIGNLGELRRIELAHCNFKGPIPKTLENLTQLIYLDFSNNNFSGPVMSFTSLTNLTEVYLQFNELNGSIISTNWSNLMNLVILDLEQNSLSGDIPQTLFRSRSLKEIYLSKNQFSGGISEVKGKYSPLLESIYLSDNKLEGPFPMFLFEIQSLRILSLSWNKFSGLIPLGAFQKLQNLSSLDLSYNNLSIDSSSANPLLPPFPPNVAILELASCNLTKFPNFLKNLSMLSHLDLSNNRIHGEIPSWIWESRSLQNLNISLNFLVDFEIPLNIIASLLVIDLHGNQLQGRIPIFPPNPIYLDYSNNNFNGNIPESICSSTSLQVL